MHTYANGMVFSISVDKDNSLDKDNSAVNKYII